MWGIIVTKTGNVWFTQYGSSSASNYISGGFLPGGQGTLWMFDPANETFQSYPLNQPGTMPFRLAEDSQDRIWFTELLGNKLGLFDPKMKQFHYYAVPTENSGPADLFVDRFDKVWFTESTAKSIGVFDPTNSTFREYPLPSLFAPVGLSIDSNDHVWVADHGLNTIVEFYPENRSFTVFPTSEPSNGIYPYSLPNDVWIDKNGVWFTEHAANRIGRIDSNRQTLTEYQIPTGPISTALWLTAAPDGQIYFTEYSSNRIGILDPTSAVPFSIHLNQGAVQIQQGSVTQVQLTLTGQAQQVNLIAGASLNPGISASFSSNPVNVQPSQTTEPIIIVDLQATQSTPAGEYVILLGASTSGASLSVLLPVKITEASPTYGIFPYVIGGLMCSIILLLFAVKRTKTSSFRSRRVIERIRELVDQHKIAFVIFGVASTNLVGAIAGGLHLLILEAPTRLIPYSNATLETYGFFAFWLDVTELGLGLLTVYFILLAWKPRKRVAFSVMLAIMLVASSLFIVTSIPNSKPSQCDVVIKNSLFYGSYYPSTIQVSGYDAATVTWCVDANSIHSDTVTSDTGLFNSGPIAQGASWSYTFTQAGAYPYHSILHFWMHGTIRVVLQNQNASYSAIASAAAINHLFAFDVSDLQKTYSTVHK
jgi:streptogramin lyase/plastocyanin